MSRARRPVVVKFGGAALSDLGAVGARIRRLQAAGNPVVAVLSARAGVTDLLLACVANGTASKRAQTLRTLDRLHPGAGSAGARHLRELERLLGAQGARTRPDPARLDRVLAFGERLAVDWAVPGLRAQGTECAGVDAALLGLWTDGRHGAATIDVVRSRRPVRDGLRPLLARGVVPVITGFYGRGRNRGPVTLGRGGSDYSASALGAVLNAEYVELVKREVSILSADPAIVPTARPVRHLTFAEAEELAEFGARVLHPMTVEPARRSGIELRVRSMRTPEDLTVVGPAEPGATGVRALTLSPIVRLFRLRFPGGRRRPGVLADVCARLAAAGIPVLQAFTSAAVVSLVVESNRSHDAETELARIVTARGAHLDASLPVALIAAVGSGAVREVGKFPSDLLASAVGVSATRASVTIAVPAPGRLDAIRRLHAALLEPNPRPPAALRTGRRAFGPRPGRPRRPPMAAGR